SGHSRRGKSGVRKNTVAPRLHAAHDGHQETGAVIPGRGIRGISLWIILTLLVLLTIYGLYERKLFAQEIWSRAGLERFLIFAAAYTVCFVAISLWKPSLFLPGILCLVIVYTIAAAGLPALLAVCL